MPGPRSLQTSVASSSSKFTTNTAAFRIPDLRGCLNLVLIRPREYTMRKKGMRREFPFLFYPPSLETAGMI